MLGRTLRGSGELLITMGVVVLLFVAYLLYWTDFENSQTQSGLDDQFNKQVSQTKQPEAVGAAKTKPIAGPTVGTGPVVGTSVASLAAPGTGIARIHVPRIDLRDIMVEGVDPASLEKGPGHVTTSAQPGQLGNFAVSGHRTTYGKPFNRLAEVKPGDHVVIETTTDFYTYVVTGEINVDPSDGIVVTNQTPPIGDQPTSATHILTFTTCTPEFSAAQRLVLRAVLISDDLRSSLTMAPGQLPPSLQPGVV